jgi:HK97 gp10 family phage protein
MKALTVTFDKATFDSIIADQVEKVEAAIRPAAFAGSRILYSQVKRNTPSSNKSHWFHGKMFKINGTKYLFEPGSLFDSIYQKFSKDNSGTGKAEYHISWNHKKVPYGFMVEYGTSRAPAHPFLNPAWARRDDALAAVETEFFKRMK